MSQLRVSAQGQSDFYLNVLSFDSPIIGEMNAGQNKSQIQYFPIKAFQPELSCDVIFPSEVQWQQWQDWVRANMLNAQKSNATGNPGVTLNWPQRSINNWTGIIATAKVGGMRRNYAPRVRVEFQLITSLVSNLGVFSSWGTSIEQSLISTSGGGGLDSLLALPQGLFGSLTPGNASILSDSGFAGFGGLIGGGAGGVAGGLIPGIGGL